MGMAYRLACQRAQTPPGDSGESRDRCEPDTHTVRGNVGGLTADQHAAIILSYYGALTWQQAARAAGRSAHTTARAQRDALIRLRDRPPLPSRRVSAGRPSPFPRATRYQPVTGTAEFTTIVER